MAMLACKLLGIDEPIRDKPLIVYAEIDRCMTDEIAAVTGCRLGKRTLKHIDYGKCACTLNDQPGPPINRAICSICGEGINDRREVHANGQVLCRACLQGAYYEKVETPGYHMLKELCYLTN
jgi:formylmethanofuran dehydrogenase subunit E